MVFNEKQSISDQMTAGIKSKFFRDISPPDPSRNYSCVFECFFLVAFCVVIWHLRVLNFYCYEFYCFP